MAMCKGCNEYDAGTPNGWQCQRCEDWDKLYARKERRLTQQKHKEQIVSELIEQVTARELDTDIPADLYGDLLLAVCDVELDLQYEISDLTVWTESYCGV